MNRSHQCTRCVADNDELTINTAITGRERARAYETFEVANASLGAVGAVALDFGRHRCCAHTTYVRARPTRYNTHTHTHTHTHRHVCMYEMNTRASIKYKLDSIRIVTPCTAVGLVSRSRTRTPFALSPAQSTLINALCNHIVDNLHFATNDVVILFVRN
jgi:hypothetical protein